MKQRARVETNKREDTVEEEESKNKLVQGKARRRHKALTTYGRMNIDAIIRFPKLRTES
jgi:hypothetical protein